MKRSQSSAIHQRRYKYSPGLLTMLYGIGAYLFQEYLTWLRSESR